jgi:Ca-activated chloride channel family protein
MKTIISILIFLVLLIDPTRIGKINSAKADAKKTFNEGNYKEAIKKYRYLIDDLKVDEDEVKLNLAHAYYLAKDTASAKPIYQNLTQSLNNEIRSKALQQLGVMNNSLNKSEEALAQFKQAIKADPSNEDARYNYEMLKKKLEEKKKQDQQNQQNKDDRKKQDQNKDQQNKNDQNKQDQKDKQNKEQENKDQQNQKDKQKEQEEKERKEQEEKENKKKEEEQKAKEEKEKEEKEKKEKKGEKQEAKDQKEEEQKKDKDKIPSDVQQKLELMKVSPEKAKMILDAMKNQEQQYLQQNRRKATKPKDKGKPDW